VIDRLRRVGTHPRLEPKVALVLRALTVRSTGRFIVRELTGRRAAARYRLRGSGLQVVIRHGTGDVVTLGEVFHRPDYEPPPEIARRLAALGPALSVLDLGANIGLFGLFVLSRWPQATLTGYEPDPTNAAVLRRTVAVNGLQDRWTVVEAAAAADDGELPFVTGEAALSHAAQDGEANATVRAEDVLPRLARADWLKLDIEGGEWAILGDPRFPEVAPPVVVLEFHPHLAPGPDARAAVLERLEGAGYTVAAVSDGPAGHGMAWAWRAR
jgi:FkbM family methyltransferase